MDAQKVTPRDLFQSDVHYRIPHFQRAYVWNRDIHWAPLWHDLIAVAHHGQDHSPAPHFFGTIVLKQLPSLPGRPQQRIVVDGQQRLTTLQLIFAAIRHCFRRLGLLSNPDNADLVHALDSYLINGRDDLADERYKMRHVGLDFDTFKALLDTEEALTTDSPLHGCFAYFCEQVGDYLGSYESDLAHRHARSIVTAATEHFLLFSLNLNANENEYLIYETLNARGEALTEWDKAKNHFLAKYSDALISEKPGIYPDAEDHYDRYFNEYDSDVWWRQDAAQRRFVGNRISLLLNHWLKIRLLSHIPHNHSYHRLTHHIRDVSSIESVVGIAESLKNFAGTFRELECWPDDTSVMGMFRYRRRVLRVGVVVPVMMILRQKLDSDGCDQGARAIESFLIRRLLLGYNARHYDRVFLNVLQRVCKSPDTHAVMAILDALDSSSECDWPDDDEVVRSVVNREVWMASDRLRMILEAIEAHLIPPTAGHQGVPRTLWIEHIMPRKWEDGWPLPTASEDEKARRNHFVATLGNLTLTTAKLDIRLSNQSWEQKRAYLRSEDNLFLNKQLLDDVGDRPWDEETIAARGRKLGEIICRIWPHSEQLRRDFRLV